SAFEAAGVACARAARKPPATKGKIPEDMAPAPFKIVRRDRPMFHPSRIFPWLLPCCRTAHSRLGTGQPRTFAGITWTKENHQRNQRPGMVRHGRNGS